MRRLVVAFVLLGPSAQQAVFAQSGADPAAGVRSFSPDYYDEYDPLTALDLVNRTPGFNAQESDGGRGLSGVRSNTLINGRRPPPKGQSIRQILDEMRYDDVERIELIDAGARLDIDMQGYPQVVNVVTIAEREARYEVVTEIRRTGTGDTDQQNEQRAGIDANGSFSWNGNEFSVRTELWDISNESPADFVAIDPGNPEQRISSLSRFERSDENLELGAFFDLGFDSSMSFNASFFEDDRMSSPILLLQDDTAAAAVDEAFVSANDRWEVSSEYRRPLGARGTLMLAVADGLTSNLSEASLNDNGLVRSSVNDRESGETAIRLRLTQKPTAALTVRTTGTTAFNFFEGAYRLLEDGIELPIQGSDSRVEEDRQSLGSAVDWNLNNQWTFTGELGVESYDIRSSEAATGIQTDPRGSVAMLFRPRDRTTFTLESEREIGQLSFSGFLASSSLSSGILTAGADVLEPERRWVHSASYDKRFGDVGVLRVVLSREEVENPIRQVALSDVVVVSRNTSSQTINSLQASIDYPFESFGREDLVLSLSGRLSDSATIDPVTGEIREVSGINSWFWNIGLRRDPGDGRVAWGFEVSEWVQGDSYSVRTIRSQDASHDWQAYVSWEPIDGLKFRTRLEGPSSNWRETRLFASVRAPGLEPFFLATTTTATERSGSFSVEWRRMERLEITASLSTRPSTRTEESLRPFGESSGTLLVREIASAPRAVLRFRFYN